MNPITAAALAWAVLVFGSTGIVATVHWYQERRTRRIIKRRLEGLR